MPVTKRQVENMQEVYHRGDLPYYGNGYWELEEQQETKKRTLDDLDLDTLKEKHDSKRKCIRFELGNTLAISDLTSNALEKNFTRLEKQQALVPNWYLYRLTQTVNIDWETCYEALVVAPSKEDAKFISPWNCAPGWWAETTHAQNALRWVEVRECNPMPLWYLSNADRWVHPAFVDVQLITSFNGDPKMHGRCISSSH